MSKFFIIRLKILCIIPGLFLSCNQQKEEPENKKNYILFGHFYGFCLGEKCIEIYKLTDNELFEDIKDEYPDRNAPYVGEYVKMDAAKFDLVKGLADNIPSELLSEQDTVIGMPDVTDGGGIYFAINNTSGTRFWLIDQFDHNIPEYLRPFKEQINNSISMISD